MFVYHREFVIFLLFHEAPRMRHIGNQPNNTNQMCGSEWFGTHCLYVNKPVIVRHVCKPRPIRIREWFPLHDLHTLRYRNLAIFFVAVKHRIFNAAVQLSLTFLKWLVWLSGLAVWLTGCLWLILLAFGCLLSANSHICKHFTIFTSGCWWLMKKGFIKGLSITHNQ